MKTSVISDSRMADYYVSGRRINGRSWLANANAYMGCTLDVIGNYAISGKRSDEYLAEANFAQMLTDGAQVAIIGYPFVNDLDKAQAGYVDTDGNAVTLANLQSLVMPRLKNRIQRLLAAGKIVCPCTEPGSANLGAAAVQLVHSINSELRATYTGMDGVYLFDPVEQIWSRATTSTVIVMKPGYSVDGTHATTRQGNFIGRYAAERFFPTFLTRKKSYGVDLATAVQLYPNPGYANATGGTTGNITGTDPIPANVNMSGSAGGLASYTASIAPAADGSGNEVTLTVTATGAVNVRWDNQGINAAGLGYTDQFVGGLDVTTVQSTNCRVYGDMQVFTTQGTEDGFVVYSGDPADVWTADGATGEMRMQSAPTTPPPGSSSGLAPKYRLFLDFKAAGTVTVKLKDPTVYKK